MYEEPVELSNNFSYGCPSDSLTMNGLPKWTWQVTRAMCMSDEGPLPCLVRGKEFLFFIWHDYSRFQSLSNLEDSTPCSFKMRLTPTWFEHAAFWSGVRRATNCATEPYVYALRLRYDQSWSTGSCLIHVGKAFMYLFMDIQIGRGVAHWFPALMTTAIPCWKHQFSSDHWS